MFQVIAFMFAGIATGYIFRRRKAGFVQFLITGLIWALLFLLGLEVGHNDAVVKKIATLGLEASVIAIAATLGSIVAAKWLWGKGRKKNGSSANDALL